METKAASITPICRSWKLLRDSFKGITKAWAYYFNLSANSMHRMCEEPKSDHNPDASGQRNFLDEAYLSAKCLQEEGRIEQMHELGRWLAHVNGGFFTPNMEPTGIVEADFYKVVNELLKTMTATTEELRTSYFSSDNARSFTKDQRAIIHRRLNDVMSASVTAHEFIRLHKAEKGKE